MYEDGRHDRGDSDALGRGQQVLEPRGRKRPPEEPELEVANVGDVDRESGVVGDPAHQLVGEEDHDERKPIAEEEPGAADEDRDQAERHEQDVRRDPQAAREHQPDDQRAVSTDRDEQPALGAAPSIDLAHRRHDERWYVPDR